MDILGPSRQLDKCCHNIYCYAIQGLRLMNKEESLQGFHILKRNNESRLTLLVYINIICKWYYHTYLLISIDGRWGYIMNITICLVKIESLEFLIRNEKRWNFRSVFVASVRSESIESTALQCWVHLRCSSLIDSISGWQ